MMVAQGQGPGGGGGAAKRLEGREGNCVYMVQWKSQAMRCAGSTSGLHGLDWGRTDASKAKKVLAGGAGGTARCRRALGRGAMQQLHITISLRMEVLGVPASAQEVAG